MSRRIHLLGVRGVGALVGLTIVAVAIEGAAGAARSTIAAAADTYVRADQPGTNVATPAKVDPKLAKGIDDIVKWRRRNREAINGLLPRTHWPRDIKHLEERLATIQTRLGERRRMFHNLHRLNCVLTLMLLELRGEASVSAWARILRENHRAHEGKPPPRRLHEGELLIP